MQVATEWHCRHAQRPTHGGYATSRNIDPTRTHSRVTHPAPRSDKTPSPLPVNSTPPYPPPTDLHSVQWVLTFPARLPHPPFAKVLPNLPRLPLPHNQKSANCRRRSVELPRLPPSRQPHWGRETTPESIVCPIGNEMFREEPKPQNHRKRVHLKVVRLHVTRRHKHTNNDANTNRNNMNIHCNNTLYHDRESLTCHLSHSHAKLL